MLSLHAAKLAFIKALHSATLREAIKWRIVADAPYKDIWRAEIDGDVLEVERLALPGFDGVEPIMYRIMGLQTWLCCCAGTEGYNLVLEMLAPPSAIASATKNLAKATNRVNAL